MADLYNLWKDYPKYFDMLEQMEKDSHNTFKPNMTLKEIRQKFESGKVYKNKKMKDKQITLFDLIKNKREGE